MSNRNLQITVPSKVSTRLPEYTAEVTGVGVLRILDAIKEVGLQKEIKYKRIDCSRVMKDIQSVML